MKTESAFKSVFHWGGHGGWLSGDGDRDLTEDVMELEVIPDGMVREIKRFETV